jgi:LysM repeat protein
LISAFSAGFDPVEYRRRAAAIALRFCRIRWLNVGGERIMTQLADQQLAQHVVRGGFVGEERAIGVAIVLAESSGRSDAIGDVSLEDATFGPSVGLFQIRSLKADKGSGRTRDELANLDPATNARHARQVFLDAGSRFTPWSTFNSGAHRRFLDRAHDAVAGVGHGGPVSHKGADDATVHLIETGETLSGLARSHGLTLDQLRVLNPGLFDAAHHNGKMIHPGEKVILSAPAASSHTHVIQTGETLSGIARSHRLTLDQLRVLNPGLFDAAHHNGNVIHPGEVVRL